MQRHPWQIAIYGKGGIGKSTISANLSAALAQCSLRVLQIGCDPKHDSTRLLLGGLPQPTVLELLKEGSSDVLTLADLLRVGYGGVHCLEAGGPEPGVGCAGRGILSMAQTLQKIGLNKGTYDLVLYDVLGDVVCGGFAVPMRDEYADAILIVTSGELMALYAANNICKGVRHFTSKGGKLAGIIGNERQIPRERELIEAFAQSVGSRMLAFFPRDPAFREAELQRKTVVELSPDSPLTRQFLTLADQVRARLPAVVPQPLNDQAFEELIYAFAEGQAPRHQAVSTPLVSTALDETPTTVHNRWKAYLDKGGTRLTPPPRDREDPEPRYASKAVQQEESLYSCALAGAFAVSNQLRDALTIMHAPSGCAHTSLDAAWLSAAGLEEKSHGQVESQLLPNLLCTNFTEQEAVFGGEHRLKETIEQATQRLHPNAIFIITSCPTAIIGDDAGGVARELATPNCPVIPLETDGIMKGDYAQGWINAYRNIAEVFIDPSLQPEEGLVNIVGETNVANNSEVNFAEMRRTLEALGLTIQTRFLRNTTVAAVRQFKRAALNVIGSSDSPARTIQRYLQERFGALFVEDPFPSGWTATCRWLLALAQRLHRAHAAHELLTNARRSYEQRLQRVRSFLAGKSVLIFAYTSNLSWLTEALQDAEIQIQRMCVIHSAINEGGILDSPASVPVIWNYPGDQREQAIHEYRPDLVLSNYALRGLFPGTTIATLPLCPPAGGFAGLIVLENLARKMRASHFPEGWRSDRTSRREPMGHGVSP